MQHLYESWPQLGSRHPAYDKVQRRRTDIPAPLTLNTGYTPPFRPSPSTSSSQNQNSQNQNSQSHAQTNRGQELEMETRSPISTAAEKALGDSLADFYESDEDRNENLDKDNTNNDNTSNKEKNNNEDEDVNNSSSAQSLNKTSTAAAAGGREQKHGEGEGELGVRFKVGCTHETDTAILSRSGGGYRSEGVYSSVCLIVCCPPLSRTPSHPHPLIPLITHHTSNTGTS